MMCYNTRNLSDLSNSLSKDLTGGKRASHSRSHVLGRYLPPEQGSAIGYNCVESQCED